MKCGKCGDQRYAISFKGIKKQYMLFFIVYYPHPLQSGKYIICCCLSRSMPIKTDLQLQLTCCLAFSGLGVQNILYKI